MRITADEEDRDFIGNKNFGRYEIEVDGKKIEKPIEADDVAGYVIAYIPDDNGEYALNEAKDAALRKTITGSVRIIDKWAQ